jgi:hypothetical protein
MEEWQSGDCSGLLSRSALEGTQGPSHSAVVVPPAAWQPSLNLGARLERRGSTPRTTAMEARQLV